MYVEYVFLTNWAVNTASLMLATSFAGYDAKTSEMLAGAAFIAGDALIGFDGIAAGALRLVFAVIGCRFATLEKPPAVTVSVFFLFVLFSAAVNGTAYTLSLKFPELRRTFFSAVLATAVIVVAAISELLSYLVFKRKSVTDFVYDVRIKSENSEIETRAYYDSGNTMRENGLPVIILSEKFAEKHNISGQKSVFVSTVTGVKRLRASPLEIEVYFDGGANKVYETFGAIADTDVKADVILHSCMRED